MISVKFAFRVHFCLYLHLQNYAFQRKKKTKQKKTTKKQKQRKQKQTKNNKKNIKKT